MHELSIAGSIIDIVGQYVESDMLASVERIGLRIGAQSGISVDALVFGFEAITKDTPLGAARLDIEIVPFTLRCGDCGNEFVSEDGTVLCPACGSFRCTALSGTEMQVVDISLREGPDG
ncbi:MAG: hydrogenase maturation nickel metallochaperone HypA [Bacteroidota bacterium]|nr:hydrogenase maturation nickel metallochaperone HypA [Bacteroidota bacterium]